MEQPISLLEEGLIFREKYLRSKKEHPLVQKTLLTALKWQEDVNAILFDADNDGDSDLLVTCGDTRYPENSPYYTAAIVYK